MSDIKAGDKRWYLKMRDSGNEWIEVTIVEVKRKSVIYRDQSGSCYERRTTFPDFCFLKTKPLTKAI